jgi:hypothetical protein
MCIAAYGFLISETETIPPSAPRAAARRAQLELPADYRPRGAADPNRTSRPQLDRDPAPAADLRARQKRAAMSLLRANKRAA